MEIEGKEEVRACVKLDKEILRAQEAVEAAQALSSMLATEQAKKRRWVLEHEPLFFEARQAADGEKTMAKNAKYDEKINELESSKQSSTSQLTNSLMLTSKVIETRQVSFNVQMDLLAMRLAEPISIKAYTVKQFREMFKMENTPPGDSYPFITSETFQNRLFAEDGSSNVDAGEGSEGVLIKIRYDFNATDLFDNDKTIQSAKALRDLAVFVETRRWINRQTLILTKPKLDDNFQCKAVDVRIQLPAKTVNNKEVNATTTRQSEFMRQMYATWQEESALTVQLMRDNINEVYQDDEKYKYEMPNDESFYVGVNEAPKLDAKEAFDESMEQLDEHRDDLKNVSILDQQIAAHAQTIDIFKG